ncbi:MAG: hypothetical protein AAB875_01405 [Patescibacteria group bacterium]
MARHKKNNSIQEEVKPEVTMTEEAVLDSLQTEIDLARKELEATKLSLEEKKRELSLKREVSDEEVVLIDKQKTLGNEKKAKNSVIEKQKELDNVKVTGKFINRRAPGQQVKLAYIKYDDDPVKWHVFEDGKVYTIPRGFAEQINEYYHTPQFVQKSDFMNPDAPSSAIHEVDTSNKKYAFVPVNF